MNCALIFAGGTGQRMNTKSLPKQFLMIHGKPIIIHTLDVFEKSQLIDSVIVVCLESWIGYLREQLTIFGIKKVQKIVPGGKTGQDSIYNGIKLIHDLYAEDTIVLIHDGVRPLIDTDTIERNIKCVQEHGNAVTVSPALETIAVRPESNQQKIEKIIERKNCLLAKAPQSFFLKDIYTAHQLARSNNLHDFIDSAYLMQWAGYKLFTVEGPVYNIKITTPADFYVFHAILDAHENGQINGFANNGA
ncbi:MAG: 2-C-methyl-D-erythritol 4-phosphate cytidylyltransferase [Flexilinea sp.]|nr:2-C-methyl-D-erythritol 4-phosphate cytidylyltransferase [Flexilinea sp.]